MDDQTLRDCAPRDDGHPAAAGAGTGAPNAGPGGTLSWVGRITGSTARCFSPYCDRPIARADAHHLVPVEAGGPTTVANGALPCDGHQVLLHEGRWQAIRLPDGRYQLYQPTTGKAIGPEEHPPGHNRPPPHRRRE